MWYHCLYLSSAREPFDETALRYLLAQSRRNNEADGISGMLLHGGGNFIQYIEGEADAVQALFRRIGNDPRHSGVLVVSEGPVRTRLFRDWSMGFRGLSAGETAKIGGFEISRAALQEKLVPDAPKILVAMMHNFYEATHRFATN